MDKTTKTIDTYNKTAENFEIKFMDLKLYREALNRFIDMLKPGSVILDLGCGPGNVAKLLVDTQKNFLVTGIDLSPEMVNLARKNVPEAKFEVGDVRQINVKEGAYDCIMAAFCLPHLTNEEASALIEKIGLLLRQGGLLYLSCMEGQRSGYEYTSFSPENEIFFNYYKENFLKNHLSANKLELLHLTRQDYPEEDGSTTIDMIFIAKKDEK
ncbi:MAG: class I SAM-dependent methyltransferase [Bacillota bacterium]